MTRTCISAVGLQEQCAWLSSGRRQSRLLARNSCSYLKYRCDVKLQPAAPSLEVANPHAKEGEMRVGKQMCLDEMSQCSGSDCPLIDFSCVKSWNGFACLSLLLVGFFCKCPQIFLSNGVRVLQTLQSCSDRWAVGNCCRVNGGMM